MATLATSSSPLSTPSSSSSSSCPRWKYNVFLSFCGIDTRKNFTDHVYTVLKQKGITTFRDDEKLERGKYISEELLKAIEESKYAIIVLSTNYTSSKWCLKELAKIVECMEKTKLTVLPVFYHVNPSDVRNQMSDNLAKAFAEHAEETKVNTEDVQAWKAALKIVGGIAGWHVHDSFESKVIQEIIGKICTDHELYHKFSSVCEDPVGMDSRVEEMLGSYLGEGLGDVCFVGICGMGGMGKTTLAEEIYRRISSNFEVSNFIANVREKTKNKGLVSLQKQLLSKILMKSEIEKICNVCDGISLIRKTLYNKKIFIVLDDVDGEEQLGALAQKDNCFGPGSRIIVTSRDSHLLKRCGVKYIYTAKRLSDNDALKLFSWKAFHKPHPEENFVNLSMDFVNYAEGLPLALKVLGSLLFDKTIDAWNGALNNLKAEFGDKIMPILQISFDGLTNTQKGLFLDIACFFKGENKDCIRDVLQSFGYCPEYNIDVLKDKSLITISYDGILWMHDLLQDMGQEIVHRKSREPGGRSRLWILEDVIHVLKNNTGTEAVEGIMLKVPIQKMEHLHAEAFSKMKNLRLLKIGNEKFPQDFINGTKQLPRSLNYLSNKLRIMEWHGYPFKSMPTSFEPNKLVELKMCCSSIKHLWKGVMNLDELKLIDLSDSQNLIEMPNLSGAPKLKHLILQRCIKLSKIHASLGNHKQLIRLDLNGCKCLESLPHKINSKVLEIFNLGGCSRLKKFPEFVGNMSHLSELCFSGTAIKHLPLSAEHLTSLTKLDLRDCKNLSSLPNDCCYLMSLKILTLSGCSKLNELPENLGNIKSLEELDVSETAITELPSSLVLLKNLKVLSLRGCEGLTSISSNKLISFPLMRKRRVDPTGMLGRSLSNLWSLTKLNLSYCNLQAIPDGLGCLSSLTNLDLRGNYFVYLPESTTQLSNMKILQLCGCTHLRSLPELPLNIRFLDADGCTSLEILPLKPEDGPYPTLYLLNCVKLVNDEDYGDMLLTTLRHHIQFKGDGDNYGIMIPGREISKWFSHQSVGTSVSLQVPSDKLKGVAVCALFVLRQHHPLHELPSKNGYIFTHTLYLYLKANGYESRPITGFTFSEQFGKIESYHLCQYYYPYESFNQKLKENWSQADANGLGQIEIGFETKGPGLEVTKCGARWVYEQDIEDLNQTMHGCSSSSCSITPYENDLEDSAKDTKTE
ncbi:TMV resistance protein N-like isoform X2 [Quercus lobata]|uniref:TMV resistance protein N-like isoform X2 n=1 Tax=Quercus lobata TaxID=97700 RepID=UPI001244E880|nr:TMV resistance protein N-like isoform X2 [Quercus lobata]